MTADVLIENHGSIALFTPLTADAHQWIEKHVIAFLLNPGLINISQYSFRRGPRGEGNNTIQ